MCAVLVYDIIIKGATFLVLPKGKRRLEVNSVRFIYRYAAF